MSKSFGDKHFSITDPTHINTVIYQVNETEPEFINDSPRYTIERLNFTEQVIGENKRKTFYLEDEKSDGSSLVILSFGKEKVVVNVGVLENEIVKISKQPVPIKFKTLYSDKEAEYKDFAFTPNLKRPISIIDPETTEEVKPTLYIDESTNEVKGKCKLQPYKSYFAFEIREDNGNE